MMGWEGFQVPMEFRSYLLLRFSHENEVNFFV